MYEPNNNYNSNSYQGGYNHYGYNSYNDDERVDGEYHFRGSNSNSYSDAGYIPAGDAGNIPPRYHYTVTPPEKEKPKKQRRGKGIGAGGLIAACLACALVGGIAGGGVMGLVQHNRQETAIVEQRDLAAASDKTTITVVEPSSNNNSTSVTTNQVSSGGVMSATDIYNQLATRQVVAITSEITYTNIWGYTSSGAVSGSGFIISSDGYILTNYHVIEDAAKGGYDIQVLMYDGSEYTASIVGYEAENDVAVLKIDASDLSAVTIGDSDAIQVGEVIYAVGNPLGELQFSMSTGSVSALDREITSTDSQTRETKTINMFQVDAAVNSGNSGGPIYNNRGEVIGIVTAKYGSSGVEGLGFAIPINDAISIAEDLMTKGYVSGKASMGIRVQNIDATTAEYYNLVPGAYVYGVTPGSAAEAAGLQAGDVVVALGGTEVTSSSTLTEAKREYKAGETTTVRVYRGGEYLDFDITFDEEVPTQTQTQTQTQTPNGFGYQR